MCIGEQPQLSFIISEFLWECKENFFDPRFFFQELHRMTMFVVFHLGGMNGKI